MLTSLLALSSIVAVEQISITHAFVARAVHPDCAEDDRKCIMCNQHIFPFSYYIICDYCRPLIHELPKYVPTLEVHLHNLIKIELLKSYDIYKAIRDRCDSAGCRDITGAIAAIYIREVITSSTL